MYTDTIAAIATGMTNSGIGIVRVSGNDAVAITDKVFRMKGKRSLCEMESHTVHYGYLYDGEEKIDEVMVLLMRAPRSYTREDTVEIDCHGGVYVVKRVLDTLIKYGARPAEPGEYTKRAFLNGRIDLSQAESVIDLISSQNEYARKSSLLQLSGQLSNEIKKIRGEILHEIAFIESALDDPEHVSLDGYGDKLTKIVDNHIDHVERLWKSSDNGRMLREGISTVIVGKPNVGKSSILNTLLGQERAIVTDIAGTTRDALEEQINLNGILLNIVDTAGIRETRDVVEQIGVDRAKHYLRNADLVIYVVDSSLPLDENDYEIMELLEERRVIILLNKSDLKQITTEDELKKHLDKKMIAVSAREKTGISDLEEAIGQMFFNGDVAYNDEVFITNTRHKYALQEALQALKLVRQSIDDGMEEDFYSIDLMHAYEELGKIIGEEIGEDLVNEIFSKFCMGK